MLRADKDQIKKFLADSGYTSNPDGLIEFWPFDFVKVHDGECYLDINANAVRRGDEVPDRPIRMLFRKTTEAGTLSRWEFISAREIEPDVKSEALDREKHFPKISPWPSSVVNKAEPAGVFQCEQFVAAGRRCVRKQGHVGPCDAGVNPYAKNGTECIFCQQRFISMEEFDAHAPCPKA